MTELVEPMVTHDPVVWSLVDAIDLNNIGVVERLTNRGLTAAHIGSSTIHFAERSESEKEGLVTYGVHDGESHAVTVYLEPAREFGAQLYDEHFDGTRESGLRYAEAQGIDPEILVTDQKVHEITQTATEKVVNNILNDTLHHELDHLVEGHLVPRTEIMRQRREYRERLRKRRSRIHGALVLTAGATMFSPIAESYLGVEDQQVLIDSLYVGGGVGTVLTFAALYYEWRTRSGGPQDHKDYLNRPWEVNARNFAAEQAANDAGLLTVRFKPGFVDARAV